MSKVAGRITAHGALLVLICVLLTCSPIQSAYAAGDIAVISKQPIYVDGWSALMTAYSINDANFVRLRDIAYYIDFDATYNSADKTIHITTKEPYSGERSGLGPTPERTEAIGVQLPIYVDGQEVTMLAYNIGGNNYVKLRDIAAAVDFGAEWDPVQRRVLIDTEKPYTPEPATTQDTSAPGSAIPGGTVADYSLEANPAIFDEIYTRAKYNIDRQHVLDTGEITTGWGIYLPTNATAIDAANYFFNSLTLMTELEKIQSINSFLCTHMTYSASTAFSSNDFWTSTAYGVCEQYAQTFRYMCYRAGIICIFVKGVADGNGHGWNEVYMDGEWLFYDGNLSDVRQTIALGEVAKRGHTYTIDYPDLVMYRKELYVPSSTL